MTGIGARRPPLPLHRFYGEEAGAKQKDGGGCRTFTPSIAKAPAARESGESIGPVLASTVRGDIELNERFLAADVVRLRRAMVHDLKRQLNKPTGEVRDVAACALPIVNYCQVSGRLN